MRASPIKIFKRVDPNILNATIKEEQAESYRWISGTHVPKKTQNRQTVFWNQRPKIIHPHFTHKLQKSLITFHKPESEHSASKPTHPESKKTQKKKMTISLWHSTTLSFSLLFLPRKLYTNVHKETKRLKQELKTQNFTNVCFFSYFFSLWAKQEKSQTFTNKSHFWARSRKVSSQFSHFHNSFKQELQKTKKEEFNKHGVFLLKEPNLHQKTTLLSSNKKWVILIFLFTWLFSLISS